MKDSYVRRRCTDERCGVTLVYPRDQVPDKPICHRCRALSARKSTEPLRSDGWEIQ